MLISYVSRKNPFIVKLVNEKYGKYRYRSLRPYYIIKEPFTNRNCDNERIFSNI